jgi:Holliday junction resolvase RusA-like endonuclease
MQARAGRVSVTLVIPGTPTAKARPKFVRATGRTYTPARTALAENRVWLAWQDAGRPRLADGPVCMRVDFVLTRPQGHWKADGTLSAAGQRSDWPTKKPDVDNACKLVADALNGCAFRDDSQIVMLQAVKLWIAEDRIWAAEGALQDIRKALAGWETDLAQAAQTAQEQKADES